LAPAIFDIYRAGLGLVHFYTDLPVRFLKIPVMFTNVYNIIKMIMIMIVLL